MSYDNWKCRSPDDGYPDHESIAAHFERELIEAEAKIASLRDILLEAHYFMADDFPNGPDGPAIASDRYRAHYKAVVAAISPTEQIAATKQGA
jgi:hypothetical protein